jgi:hypothetical protein
MAEQETPVVAPKVTAAPLAVKSFEDTTPSNWEITKTEDDKIVAVSNATLERFEGTIEDFNKLLRG